MSDSAQVGEAPWVYSDPASHRFQVNRSTLLDPEILKLERRRIFDVCWVYVGHESEVRAPGDFKTRIVCERPVIFCRDSKNRARVFLNTCRHRGAAVCREAEGNAKTYTCFYHGWSYNRDGELDGVPGQDAFRSEEHTSELQSRLHLVCRLLLEKKKNR